MKRSLLTVLIVAAGAFLFSALGYRLDVATFVYTIGMMSVAEMIWRPGK